MGTETTGLVVHPRGEQPEIEAWSAVADTYAGRVHVEWDATAPLPRITAEQNRPGRGAERSREDEGRPPTDRLRQRAGARLCLTMPSEARPPCIGDASPMPNEPSSQ
jgi:hypothetical protein